MLVVSLPALLMADKWGRRTSAISGGVGLSGCMLLIGSLYAANAVHSEGAARWVVIVAVFAFGLIYCGTWGIVGKIYASEIQPSHTRGAANCAAMGLSHFTNWLVAMLTPILLESSSHAAYFLFGGLALANTLILTAYMPETKGRSLEDIQEAFQRPSLESATSALRRFVGLGRVERRRPGGRSQEVEGVELERIDAQPAGAAMAASGVRVDIR
jgi:MFS family permease